MNKKIMIATPILLCAQIAASAAGMSIPEDQLDAQQVYYGSTAEFERPAEVDFEEAIQATPEWQEIRKQKIKRGTGKYWILISRASTRATRAVASVGEETEYDLIAKAGYLGNLEPAVAADDVTEQVVAKIESDDSAAGGG